MTGGTALAPKPTAVKKPEEVKQVIPNGALADCCGQWAYARVYMTPDSFFDLCCHHYRRHKVQILAVAFDVIDETARMDGKLDASA